MRIVRLTLLFLSLALAPLALLAANEPPPEKVRALLQMSVSYTHLTLPTSDLV